MAIYYMGAPVSVVSATDKGEHHEITVMFDGGDLRAGLRDIDLQADGAWPEITAAVAEVAA